MSSLLIYQVVSDQCGFSEETARFFHRFLPAGAEITNDESIADLIIIFDEVGRRNPKQREFRYLFNRKAFTYSQIDSPIPLLPGVYVSLRKKHLRKQITLSGAYLNYLSETNGNAFCQGVDGTQTCKEYLFSFTGRPSHRIRQKLMDQFASTPDVFVRNTDTHYDHWGERNTDQQKHFVETIARSKFSICPRGAGASSLRLFESLKLGVAPVIIADDWVPPEGPDWEKFSIFVKEEEIPDLYDVLKSRESEALEMGRLASKAHDEFFTGEKITERMLHSMSQMMAEFPGISEYFRRSWALADICRDAVYWYAYFKAVAVRDAIRSRSPQKNA